MKTKSQSQRSRYVETILCVGGGLIGLLTAVIQETAEHPPEIDRFTGTVDPRILGLMLVSIFAVCLPFFINDSHFYTSAFILFCGVVAMFCGGVAGLIGGGLITVGGVVALCRT
ncbi:hypothetical protein PQ472_05845 [Lacticaseibacillus pabuli]|uniref:Uncharacterized protein n=1 Tax=Lacticaseibacillus pabuli TaxID=3025672 RepID=A0ABY7WUB9_9LACO|nr:hypothetical protein [Lacticaseibacillus sp. KACC 23028]WDF83759.1 hypothetical protein PQ472_05845 [Lacticaseibacillus sp. KACC 23028]